MQEQTVSVIQLHTPESEDWAVTLTIPLAGGESITLLVNQDSDKVRAHEEGRKLFRALRANNQTNETFFATTDDVQRAVLGTDEVRPVPQVAFRYVDTLEGIGR